MTDRYRYEFADELPMDDVEASFLLALVATECLHGPVQVRLDAAHYLDLDHRAGVIDAGSPVGRDLNRLFLGLLQREFGDDAVRVTALADEPSCQHVMSTSLGLV